MEVSEPISDICYYESTDSPSISPSSSPTNIFSSQPSNNPSSYPSLSPTNIPSTSPSVEPSAIPSSFPSVNPSFQPSTPPTMAYAWEQIGSDMYGTSTLQEYGKSVAISKNGKILAISQHTDSRIDIYDYIDGLWKRRNVSIFGEVCSTDRFYVADFM
jgi:hypothetical protein